MRHIMSCRRDKMCGKAMQKERQRDTEERSERKYREGDDRSSEGYHDDD